MLTVIAFTAALLTPDQWIVSDETSRMDGRRSYMAAVQSDGAMLSLNCINGRRSVILLWSTYLGRDDVIARWKFDDGQVQERQIPVLTGGRNAMIEGRVADRFLTEVAGAETVVVDVSGYSGRREVVFDVSGAAEVVATARAACPGR